MTIKVGDIVTWQNKLKRSENIKVMPLKITGCRVVELGRTNDGKPAAQLDCGRQFGRVNAYVADLELEEVPKAKPEERRKKPKLTIISGG